MYISWKNHKKPITVNLKIIRKNILVGGGGEDYLRGRPFQGFTKKLKQNSETLKLTLKNSQFHFSLLFILFAHIIHVSFRILYT